MKPTYQLAYREFDDGVITILSIARELSEELHCTVVESAINPGQEFVVAPDQITTRQQIGTRLLRKIIKVLDFDFACNVEINNERYIVFGRKTADDFCGIVGGKPTRNPYPISFEWAVRQIGNSYMMRWVDENMQIIFPAILIVPSP